MRIEDKVRGFSKEAHQRLVNMGYLDTTKTVTKVGRSTHTRFGYIEPSGGITLIYIYLDVLCAVKNHPNGKDLDIEDLEFNIKETSQFLKEIFSDLIEKYAISDDLVSIRCKKNYYGKFGGKPTDKNTNY